MLGMVRQGAVLALQMELGMFKMLSSIAAVLVFSLALAAQTAEQIVARHIEAMGGLDRLKSLLNVRRTEMVDDGSPVKDHFTLIKERSDKFRLESVEHLSDGRQVPVVHGCDGRTNWLMMFDRNPSATVFDCKVLADIDGPLVDYAAKGSVIKLAGKTKIGDQEAYDLELTWKENKGHPAHFYIDVRTFLLVRILVQSDAEYHQETLSDYRRVDGVMVAFLDDMRWWPLDQNPPEGEKAGVLKVEKAEGHQKQILEKIEFNVQIDDSIFAMPSPAATK